MLSRNSHCLSQSRPRDRAIIMHIAVLLSGQRRTFDAVRNSWEANLVCPLTRKDFTVVTFACWDDRAWRWPTSRTFDVLIQFERNHACWERAKTFESQHSVRFNVVIKARPDVRFNVPMADVLNAASAASIKRSLLSKARCWMPGEKLPKQSWTWGHMRCGSQPLGDDALFIVPSHELADDVFAPFDDDLMAVRNASAFPRCDTSFKASVIPECLFATHLKRRGIGFTPTPLDVTLDASRLRAQIGGDASLAKWRMTSSAQPSGGLSAPPPFKCIGMGSPSWISISIVQ